MTRMRAEIWTRPLFKPFMKVPVFVTVVPAAPALTCMCGVAASRPAEGVATDAGTRGDEIEPAVVVDLRIVGAAGDLRALHQSASWCGQDGDAGACDDASDLALVDDLRVAAGDLRVSYKSASWGGRNGTQERAVMKPTTSPSQSLTIFASLP